jgi:hypothetical protein
MVTQIPLTDNTLNFNLVWARFCPAGFCCTLGTLLRVLVSFVFASYPSRLDVSSPTFFVVESSVELPLSVS